MNMIARRNVRRRIADDLRIFADHIALRDIRCRDLVAARDQTSSCDADLGLGPHFHWFDCGDDVVGRIEAYGQ